MLNGLNILLFPNIPETLNILENKPVEDLNEGGNAKSKTQAKQATPIG